MRCPRFSFWDCLSRAVDNLANVTSSTDVRLNRFFRTFRSQPLYRAALWSVVWSRRNDVIRCRALDQRVPAEFYCMCTGECIHRANESAEVRHFFVLLFSQMLVSGLEEINVADWRRSTRLKHCNHRTDVVRWFWRAVGQFDNVLRARLLQFVTGSPRVPLCGLKALGGKTKNAHCQHCLIIQPL